MTEFSESKEINKFEVFKQELRMFNEETNNFLNYVYSTHELFLDDKKNERARNQALATKEAIEEYGLTSEDRQKFRLIWYETVDLTNENIDFAINYLKKVKQIYQDLRSGKYRNTNFTTEQLNG